MKNMYVFRGLPNSGKSTVIKENDFQALTVSLDSFRELYAGLSTDVKGNHVLSQEKEQKVFSVFMDALESRLKDNSPIIVDNMNISKNSVSSIYELGKKYNYNIQFVEFPLLPLETYLERNSNREPYKKVPEYVIKNNYEKIQDKSFYDYFKESKVISVEDMVNELNASPEELIINLDNYKKIHHIGDLQGCYQPLKDYLNNEGGFKKDEFYIFVGDYVDRGIENAKVIKFINHIKDYSNVILIAGNHERHIFNYAYEIQKPSPEFVYSTLPELKREGVDDKEMLKNLCSRFKEFFFYEYKGKKVFVNHAGLGSIPSKPNMINGTEYMFGYGYYDFDIDEEFKNNNLDNDWYQIHGHRNKFRKLLKPESKSFPLESEVEFGGYLSTVQLDKNGFKPILITNNIFDLDKKTKNKEKEMFIKRNFDKVGDFISEKADYSLSIEELVQKLRESDLIRERKFGNMSSFNFTREAFLTKSFDSEYVATARGLFINTDSNEIVARGYDKFFNINERGAPVAKMENIKEHYTGPFTLFNKENGYLGILGYDSSTDELIFCSKSTPESDFAHWFKEIIHEQLSKEDLHKLKMTLRLHNCSAVFEVNDPINDPHIVKYEERHVVLLDFIKRQVEMEKMDYNHLVKIANDLNLPVKQKGPSFNNAERLELFYNHVSKESPFETKHQHEGYVIEDANSNMAKIKLPYYNYWKEMRQIKEMFKSRVKKGTNIVIEDLIENRVLLKNYKEESLKFAYWLINNPDLLESDIISVREKYLEEGYSPVSELKVNWKDVYNLKNIISDRLNAGNSEEDIITSIGLNKKRFNHLFEIEKEKYIDSVEFTKWLIKNKDLFNKSIVEIKNHFDNEYNVNDINFNNKNMKSKNKPRI